METLMTALQRFWPIYKPKETVNWRKVLVENMFRKMFSRTDSYTLIQNN